MKFFPIILFCFLPAFLSAQIEDNFSDGDFTVNPAWSGDATDFTVNGDLQLQLNAPEAGVSNLYVQNTFSDSMVWEFYFRLDFDPSGSNSLQVALQSVEENFNSGTNSGYFLSLGESGSDDALNFGRMDSGTATVLATATLGAVAVSPEVRIRLERQADGTWTLLADYTGGFNFLEEFQVTDTTYGAGDYFFGFSCEYTDSRKDKFFFDDIFVEELLPDTEAPVLVSAEAISNTEVDVFFSEALDEFSATEPANFFISNGIGNPSAAFLDVDDQTLVHLSLGTPLSSPTDYVLTVENIVDLVGNMAPLQAADFSFLEIAEAAPFDILINELMVDPNPTIGLPDAEFVELFNRSDQIFDLANYGLTTGSAPQALPSFLLYPGDYVIVCDEDFETEFSAFGNVVPLASFPALSNNGDEVALVAMSGGIIHGMQYNSDTYGNPQKAFGGWSLELVNPSAPCAGEANYRAADNLLGGTPGQANSIFENTPDEKGPNIVRVFASPLSIDVFFDEYLENSAAGSVANYQLSNGANITAATVLFPANNVVRLEVAAPLEVNTAYELTFLEGLTDCLGNPIESQTVVFALPEKIEPGDLLLNEILFDAPTGGGDYVEIYNPSEKILNLGDLLIGRLREDIDTLLVPVIEDRLIFPFEFAVITSDASNVLEFFEVKSPEAILRNPLPSFNVDEGNVTLLAQVDTSVIIVDAFDYHEDMHAPLLDDVKGVSLERIDPTRPTNDASNWHSAAASMLSVEGYGTPTFLNSQFLISTGAAVDGFFEIPEKKLSPDGDGFQDFLVVNYRTDQPGYSIRAEVFDAEGRSVKTLFNNELLPTEGFFRWDGDTDRGGKARIGIYVLWIQLFHPDGTVREFKETCVVAGRF